MGDCKIKKNLLILPGYFAGIACLFIITYRTFIAFFSQDKAVTIYINKYGEQYLDFISLSIIWVIILFGLVLLIRNITRDRNVTLKMNRDLFNGFLENFDRPTDRKISFMTKIFDIKEGNIDQSYYFSKDDGKILNYDNQIDRIRNDEITTKNKKEG